MHFNWNSWANRRPPPKKKTPMLPSRFNKQPNSECHLLTCKTDPDDLKDRESRFVVQEQAVSIFGTRTCRRMTGLLFPNFQRIARQFSLSYPNEVSLFQLDQQPFQFPIRSLPPSPSPLPQLSPQPVMHSNRTQNVLFRDAPLLRCKPCWDYPVTRDIKYSRSQAGLLI